MTTTKKQAKQDACSVEVDAVVRLKNLRKELRKALGEYIESEGCSCCENIEDHKEAAEKLAKLLNVPKYKDGSGYDF